MINLTSRMSSMKNDNVELEVDVSIDLIPP